MVKKTKKELEAQIEEYINQLKRVSADFDNFKKRIEKEKEEFVKFANIGIVSKLLCVKDDFERSANNEKVSDGVNLVFNKFNSVLKDAGVESFGSAGDRFDPFRHEALLQKPASGYGTGFICEVFEKGYIFNNKIIRPAKVAVSKNEGDKK